MTGAKFRNQRAADDAMSVTAQPHFVAQLQTAPHRQPARPPALTFWQPQAHALPVQDPH
jgi:hypothetical protein